MRSAGVVAPYKMHGGIVLLSNQKSKWITYLLAVFLCTVFILTAGLTPSGRKLPGDDRMGPLNIASDIQTAADMLIGNAVNSAVGEQKVRFLPMNNLPCPKPSVDKYGSYVDDGGITHETYLDESISVDYWSFYAVGDYSYGTLHAAKVKIAHPTQLRTAFAGGAYGTEIRTVGEIAMGVNAVVAINGDYYNYPNAIGVVLRNGALYSDNPRPDCISLVIDSAGDLRMADTAEFEFNPFYRNPDSNIYQILNFGPPLVLEGVAQNVPKPEKGNEYLYLLNPRTVIAQTGPLEYLLLTADGRTEESPGWLVYDLAVILQNLGCITAYNLDGGQSTGLFFRGEIKNTPFTPRERDLGDIVFFATAVE